MNLSPLLSNPNLIYFTQKRSAFFTVRNWVFNLNRRDSLVTKCAAMSNCFFLKLKIRGWELFA